MTTSNDDLWPSADDLINEPGDRAPYLVLCDQAALLGQKTQNLVEATVTASPDPDGSSLDLRLTLVAPALGGYEYVLIEAKQPAELYPVHLQFDGGKYSAAEEEGLKTYLGKIFKAQKTRKIISSLWAQSKAQSQIKS